MQRVLTVYLAGPITGCSYQGCTDWREYVTKELEDEFVCLSPMRSKEFLENKGDIADSYNDLEDNSEPHRVLTSDKGINRRDSWDCRSTDVILMNLADLPENKEIEQAMRFLTIVWDLWAVDDLKKWLYRVSIGTMLELGMARALRKPVICVMPEGNIHEHPMVNDMIDFRCSNLPNALATLRSLR